MDEEITIIDTKTRNEKIKNFFIENKKKLIALLIIVILIFVSFFGFQEYKNAKAKKISDEFNLIVIDFHLQNQHYKELSYIILDFLFHLLKVFF